MADAPSAPWRLSCPWCDWGLWVNARGVRGADPGSGVEAALRGTEHAEQAHGRTWAEFVQTLDSRTPSV